MKDTFVESEVLQVIFVLFIYIFIPKIHHKIAITMKCSFESFTSVTTRTQHVHLSSSLFESVFNLFYFPMFNPVNYF